MADSSDEDGLDQIENVSADTTSRKSPRGKPENFFTVEQSLFLIERVLAHGSGGRNHMPWSKIQAELVAQFAGFSKTVEQIMTRIQNIKQVCTRISSGQVVPPLGSPFIQFHKLFEDHQSGKVDQDGPSSSSSSLICSRVARSSKRSPTPAGPAKRPAAGLTGKLLSPGDYRPFSAAQTKFIMDTRAVRRQKWGVWKDVLAEYADQFPGDKRSERELQRRFMDVNAQNRRESQSHEASTSEESEWEEDFSSDESKAETCMPSTSGGNSLALELILDDDCADNDEDGDASNGSNEIPMVPPGVELTAVDLKFLREMAKRSGASVQEFLDFMTPTTIADGEADYLLYEKAVQNGGSLRNLGPQSRYDRVDIIGSINRQEDSE